MVLRLASLAIILGFPWVAVPAAAQQSLGEVLDAGGKRMSAKEFETEIVQRILVGPAPTGGELELMYASRGLISGRGKSPAITLPAALRGEWKLDDTGRVCSTYYAGGIPFPDRCQYWFKLADKYYVSDSDVDRSAKVLSRTITQ
jgi:hypothetical protein